MKANGTPDRGQLHLEEQLLLAFFSDSRNALRKLDLPDGPPLLLCHISGDKDALRALRDDLRNRHPQPFHCLTEKAYVLLFSGNSACSDAETVLRSAAEAFPQCTFCVGSAFHDVFSLPGEYEKLAVFADSRWFF